MTETVTLYPSWQEKSWTAAKILYTGLTGFCLLGYLWLLVIGAGINNMPPVILIARLASVPLALYLGRPWRDKGFWILSIYTLLFSLRCFIPDPNSIFYEEVAENILSALWLFGACYSLARILNNKQLKVFLSVCTGIWIFGVVICSCISIYAAWTGQIINTLGEGFFGVEELAGRIRLFFVYLPTTAGSILGITILLCALLAVCIKSKKGKFIFIIFLIPLFLVLGLTDSRTAYISVPAGFGVMVFSGVFHHYQTKSSKNTQRSSAKAYIIGLVAMVVVFFLLVILILQITPVFNHVKTRGVIPVAYAEEAGKNTVVSSSGFSGARVLTGRAELWSSVIEHIKKNPIILLIGESKLEPLRGFDQFFAHCHCLYLQVLLESGIPGLLLFLSFIIYTIVHAIKVIRTPDLPLWIRLLPALPISLWVGDIAETFTWLRSSQCPMGAIAIISAGIICAQKTKLCVNIKQINEPII